MNARLTLAGAAPYRAGDTMSTTPVHYELKGTIAHVTMDDGKANALSREMMDAVEQALDRAQKEAAAVVLAGRPGRFCAGFDLRQMMAGPDQARAIVTRGADFLLGLYALPLPLVIACTGHALAGGALVVLTGDVRVCAAGAFRVGLNEVSIGMPLPILAMELARDRLKTEHLAAATLFATISEPEAARAMGFFDEVVEDARLQEAAAAHAQKLANLPRDPYARTKLALRERTIRYIRETLADDMARLAPPQTA
jgi:enoyl-CoA hydratase